MAASAPPLPLRCAAGCKRTIDVRGASVNFPCRHAFCVACKSIAIDEHSGRLYCTVCAAEVKYDIKMIGDETLP